MMIRKKTGPVRPEKRTSYGKSDSTGKRTAFGKTEGSKSDRTEKRATYGKKEDKGAERRSPSTLERRPRRPFGESRPSPVSKVKRHEVAEEPRRHEESRHDVIYGINPVMEAFKAGRGIEKVVNRHDLNLVFNAFLDRAEHDATDASKSVDTDLCSHFPTSVC